MKKVRCVGNGVETSNVRDFWYKHEGEKLVVFLLTCNQHYYAFYRAPAIMQQLSRFVK